jgi:hypothetical protein
MFFAKIVFVAVAPNSLQYKELHIFHFSEEYLKLPRKDFSDSLNEAVYAQARFAGLTPPNTGRRRKKGRSAVPDALADHKPPRCPAHAPRREGVAGREHFGIPCRSVSKIA